jgi:hypothetical protein
MTDSEATNKTTPIDCAKEDFGGRNHKAEDVIKDHIDKPLIVALRN